MVGFVSEKNKVPAPRHSEDLYSELTYGHTLPVHIALGSLAPLDRYLLKCLRAQRASKSGGVDVLHYRAGFGRTHIRPATAPMLDYGCDTPPQIVAHYAISSGDLVRGRKWSYEWSQREQVLRTMLVNNFLDNEPPADTAKLLADAVQHVEAVCFYLDDSICTSMERHCNLVETKRGEGRLSNLTRMPATEWSLEDGFLVAALYLLYLTGRSIRFEELNGQALTAHRLLAILRKLVLSSGIRATRLYDEFRRNPFLLARQIQRATVEIDSNKLRSRWIHGPTYFKTERVVPRPSEIESTLAVPEFFIQRYRSIRGNRRSADDFSFEDIFSTLTINAMRMELESCRADGPPQMSPVESLIDQIVCSAMCVAKSDYAMSSGLRDVGKIVQNDAETRNRYMLRLRPRDFFCCIAGTSALHATFGEAATRNIFRRVQARMQYNRWHFIAGNFSRDQVPANRHYFYPPIMVDRAEVSDQRHTGHIEAMVRYSIRAPGPDISDAPYVLGGKNYRGFYDVRVVRCSGEPFDVEEMILVRHHCRWLGVVWRVIGDFAEKNSQPFVVQGFANGTGTIIDPDVFQGEGYA